MLVSVPLLGGGWLWLRDSSLVSVRHVHIAGVHGIDALQIRTALDNAATRMTTMDFNVGALRSAVASFTVVGGLHVTTSFPSTVSISVTERPPVAALLTAGQRTAVAADGTVLGPALLASSLPTVKGSVEPSPGTHLSEPAALVAVTVLGAAPAPIARFVVRVFNGPEGLTVAMRNGLLVYFGNSARPHAKWLSLARVLTSPSAAGAWYVDVRLPERPAAGLSSTSSSSTSISTSTPVETSASDPTAAALAASLAKAVGRSPGVSAGSSAASSSGENEASSGSAGSASTGAGEAPSTSAGNTTSSSSGASTEAPATSTSEPSSAPVGGG